MLTGIHFLLSYMCNQECDDCFVYGGPYAKGTFTLKQVQEVLSEAVKIGTVEWVYFEGGEPFLFYPIMLEGVKIARKFGFKVGIVTNGYYGTSVEDSELWLEPLSKLGISDLSVSDDSFHYDEVNDNPPKHVLTAAKKLGLPVGSICIEKPKIEEGFDKEQEKGEPVVGGGVMFRGRAVEKLVNGLPKRWWEELSECPFEDLKEPKRVHIDSFGNVHICQGLCMGNIWETPLSKLVEEYNADSHPVCGPLARGGPALLAKECNLQHEEKYVDECHFCYSLRLALLDRYPQYLAPRQIYGLE